MNSPIDPGADDPAQDEQEVWGDHLDPGAAPAYEPLPLDGLAARYRDALRRISHGEGAQTATDLQRIAATALAVPSHSATAESEES